MVLVHLEGAECRLSDGDRNFELRVENLVVEPGSRIAIVGPSGCGKTTLLQLVSLLKPCTVSDNFLFSLPGKSKLDMNALWKANNMDILRHVRARCLGYVPSNGGLFPALNIRQNAELRAAIAGLNRNDALTAITRLSDRLELTNSQLDSPLQTLSRGQQIRGAILHGLVHNPLLIIADEPTSALHPNLARSIMNLFATEVYQQQGAVVVATHDIGLVKELGFTLVRGNISSPGNSNRTIFV